MATATASASDVDTRLIGAAENLFATGAMRGVSLREIQSASPSNAHVSALQSTRRPRRSCTRCWRSIEWRRERTPGSSSTTTTPRAAISRTSLAAAFVSAGQRSLQIPTADAKYLQDLRASTS